MITPAKNARFEALFELYNRRPLRRFFHKIHVRSKPWPLIRSVLPCMLLTTAAGGTACLLSK